MDCGSAAAVSSAHLGSTAAASAAGYSGTAARGAVDDDEDCVVETVGAVNETHDILTGSSSADRFGDTSAASAAGAGNVGVISAAGSGNTMLLPQRVLTRKRISG